MSDVKKSIVFKVKIGTEETSFQINCPTVGQIQQIETNKAILSKGQYGSVQNNLTVYSSFALDLMDIEATLSVLCPDFIKSLKVSIHELDLFDGNHLRSAYGEQVEPWLRDLFRALGMMEEEGEKDSKQKDEQTQQ